MSGSAKEARTKLGVPVRKKERRIEDGETTMRVYNRITKNIRIFRKGRIRVL